MTAPLEGNILLCDSVSSPFILGVIRPKIYLPSDMDGEKRELVLAHERAHLARKDHLLKPAAFAALARIGSTLLLLALIRPALP